MTLTCAIIDDEPLAISLLESYVNKTPFLRLTAKFNSALEALPVLSAQPVELLFLDIQYALDSYKVNALDYLLKPISYPDFLKAANKALQWYEHMQAPAAEIESIFIKTEYKQVQVELRKILYIEGLKDYVKIFIEDEPHPILSLMSMKSLEEMLPASRFIRVHRSFIVQPEKIKVIERNRIVFGKEYIPISDNYKPRLVEFLAQRSLNFN